MGSSQKKMKTEKVNVGVNIRIYEEKPSGIQNSITGLFTKLVENYSQYQFIFLSTGKKKIEKKGEYITANSLFLNILQTINPKLMNIYFDNFYILKLIKQKKINILIGTSYILPFFKPKSTKYITIVHDLSYLTYINYFRIYLNLVWYMKFVMPMILKRADIIVVPSEYVKNEIRKKYHTNQSKIKVIHHGKDDFYHKITNEEEFNALQKKYHISRNYCFANATNHERKNIFGLIEAFKKSNHSQEMQLIITGLLPDKAIIQLNAYIEKVDLGENIKFLGFVRKEELRTLYSFAKLFIFPSFEEGFGFPIVEAISCGCLPICSNKGALPEIIKNKKLLFNPYDIKQIAKKIDESLSFTKNEHKKQMALCEKNIKIFTWEESARKWNTVLKELYE